MREIRSRGKVGPRKECQAESQPCIITHSRLFTMKHYIRLICNSFQDEENTIDGNHDVQMMGRKKRELKLLQER